jgi:hypothetical protein
MSFAPWRTAALIDAFICTAERESLKERQRLDAAVSPLAVVSAAASA